jgi:hypothetical protein
MQGLDLLGPLFQLLEGFKRFLTGTMKTTGAIVKSTGGTMKMPLVVKG